MTKVFSLIIFLFSINAFSTTLSHRPEIGTNTLNVDCKISSTHEISASFDTSKNILWVTDTQNGKQASYVGLSLEQLNKISIASDLQIKNVSQSSGISLASVNSVNRFILTDAMGLETALLDFIDVDGESIGTAAVLGSQILRCQ